MGPGRYASDSTDTVSMAVAVRSPLQSRIQFICKRRLHEHSPDHALPTGGPKGNGSHRASGFKSFPSRLSFQPIFYPVLTEPYAIQIARDWNTKDAASGFVGYVTRFQVPTDFRARYLVKKVGSAEALELWVPAEGLDAFNRQIIGVIEVTHEFRQA